MSIGLQKTQKCKIHDSHELDVLKVAKVRFSVPEKANPNATRERLQRFSTSQPTLCNENLHITTLDRIAVKRSFQKPEKHGKMDCVYMSKLSQNWMLDAERMPLIFKLAPLRPSQTNIFLWRMQNSSIVCHKATNACIFG